MPAPYYEFEVAQDTDLDDWIVVRADGADDPFEVKFREDRGAIVVVGLRIDHGRPVTSAELRAVRLGAIATHFGAELGELLRGYHDDARNAERDLDVYRPLLPRDQYDDRDPEGALLDDIDFANAAYYHLHAWLARPPKPAEEVALTRGKGARPPSREELRAFANVYLDERSTSAGGAVTRTAARVGVNRATAHRWMLRCEAIGLLPERRSQA